MNNKWCEFLGPKQNINVTVALTVIKSTVILLQPFPLHGSHFICKS